MIENSLILKLQINIHWNEIFKSRLNDEYLKIQLYGYNSLTQERKLNTFKSLNNLS